MTILTDRCSRTREAGRSSLSSFTNRRQNELGRIVSSGSLTFVGVDPGATGCQSYEATDFLIYRRRIDTSAALILWQVGVIGELGVASSPRRDSLSTLVEYLREFYEVDQPTVIYEASPYQVCEPIVV